jgi:hypothetical protein
MDERKPPQLMASFISKQACDVAYWQILLQKYFEHPSAKD